MLQRSFPVAVTLVAAVLNASFSRDTAPPSFADSLTGPVSQFFAIPFEKYALTPNGLLRTASTDGVDRPVARTVSGTYLAGDFTFEVDVIIPASADDIAFVGVGTGSANPHQDNEPTNAVLLRIHNLSRLGFYRIDAAVAVPSGGKAHRGFFEELEHIGDYTPGEPMRFRVARTGRHVTLGIVGGGETASRTFDLTRYPRLFDTGRAHLLLGNTVAGTLFRNVAVSVF